MEDPGYLRHVLALFKRARGLGARVFGPRALEKNEMMLIPTGSCLSELQKRCEHQKRRTCCLRGFP